MNHLVALSGGKDSTAMAIRLKELNRDTQYIYFCTPTGDELPEMEAHWDKLENILGQPLVRLTDPEHPTIYDLIKHFNMLPNWRARWCTRILKIEVAQKFYETVKPAVIYIGLRADEPERKGNKLYDEDIEQCFPMQEWGWGINEVMTYLKREGVTIPRRTDCAMCFYQRIGEWWRLWSEHPDIWDKIEQLEDDIGHTLCSPGKWRNWPNKLSDLRLEFQKGRKPREIEFPKKEQKCRVCTL